MHHLVTDLAIVLGVAALTSVLFRRLGQSSVLAYLVAGLVVGPYIPIPVFADAERVSALSELGVVLVMFAVGLEFSVRGLLRVLPVAGFTGLVQVTALGIAGYTLARVVGLSPIEGVFLGGCVAISSTMVVAKVFAESPPPPGVRTLVFGVLIVQDLAAILILATLTAVARGGGPSTDLVANTIIALLGVLVVLVVIGLLVVPRFVRFVDRLDNPEILVVVAVAACFALAALAEHLGYSAALGAFLAGTLVAEAGRTHRIEQRIHPIRDVFAAVFFVSVGMSFDPRVAVDHLPLALAVSALVIVGQFVVVSTAGVLSGNGVRRSVAAGLTLGQVGEFSFIIAGVGVAAGVVGAFLQPVVVTVAAITAFSTPLLAGIAGRVSHTVDRRLPKPLQTFASLCESWFETLRAAPTVPKSRSHLRNSAIVIAIDALALGAVWTVAGFWRVELAAHVRALGLGDPIPTLAVLGVAVAVTIPLVLGLLRSARRAGQLLAERVIPTRPAGVDLGHAPRRAFIVTLQSMLVLAIGSPAVLVLTPLVGAPWGAVGLALLTVGLGIHFWRSALSLQGHVRAGAAAIGELLERQMADDDERVPEPAAALLDGFGTVASVAVEAGAAADGSTLGELDLRAATGATIVSIARDGTTRAMPSGHDRLQAGDIVVLAGGESAVEAARGRLTRSPLPPGDRDERRDAHRRDRDQGEQDGVDTGPVP